MPNLRATDYGVKEKQCTKCHDWWPASREFFYTSGHRSGELHSWCIACVLEQKRNRWERRKMEAIHQAKPLLDSIEEVEEAHEGIS